MTNREIQKKVKQFKKKFGLIECDLAGLMKATRDQGYTLVEFNHVSNEKAVRVLIESLGLEEYILRSKGFTYADKDYRIVFIHEDLNQEERTKVLAHENGHIFLGHFSNTQIIGKDVEEEYEANEFLHYLLNETAVTKISNHCKRHKKLYIALLSVLLLIISAFAIMGFIFRKDTFGEYYITSTGNKYHKSNCIFVKNKDNAKLMTKEQYSSDEYEPCGMCLPD